MGNQQALSKFQTQYTFFQKQDTKQFKQCSIYRNKYPPHDFVLEVKGYLQSQKIDTIQQALKTFKNLYFTQQQFPFLRIVNSSIQGSQSCRLPQLTLHIQFIRHNLKDFIHWRKKQKKSLTKDEIILALDAALKAYSMTKNNQLLGISLDLQDIYITVQGQIKFDPLACKFPQHLFSASEYLRTHQSCRQKNTQALEKRLMYKTNSRHTIDQDLQSKDNLFMFQIKRFINQFVWGQNFPSWQVNPQQTSYVQKKQTKRVVTSVHQAKNIKQLKQLVKGSKLKYFFVQFEKIKHDQSEAKFEKLISELSEQTQDTRHSFETSYENSKIYPFKRQTYLYY